MFCVHCGKPVVENASFCAFCGKPVAGTNEKLPNTSAEWDYTIYREYWQPGKGGRWPLTSGRTEYSVRLDNWGQDQSAIMPKIQKYLDEGWQPVSTPGPGSYTFREHKKDDGYVNITSLEVATFIVEFRRPSKPLTEQENRVLGIWQEIQEPNAGILSTVGNLLFYRKLTVEKEYVEFLKDHHYRQVGRDGNIKHAGVFYSGDGDGVQITGSSAPDHDEVATVAGNKLTLTNKWGRAKEYERGG